MKDVTIITTHFKDFLWIELLVEKILSNTNISKICEIIIINQDHCESSRDRLQKLHHLIRVVEYPISEKHFQLQGHDHAAVLNAAVLESRGQFICIFDSDAHPVNPHWLDKCEGILRTHDAVLARCPITMGSHPCFMVLKKEHTQIPLAFDERLFVDGIDTGRLIGEQLSRAGQRVFYSEPTKSFSGLWGTTYLNSVYHHGNGSFYKAGQLLTVQVTWYHHFFRDRLLQDKIYELTLFRKMQYQLVAACLGLNLKLKQIKTNCVKLKKKLFNNKR